MANEGSIGRQEQLPTVPGGVVDGLLEGKFSEAVKNRDFGAAVKILKMQETYHQIIDAKRDASPASRVPESLRNMQVLVRGRNTR